LNDTETDAVPPVLIERHARVGLLTLNRPACLNALNLETVRLFSATLKAWSCDGSIEAVVVRGADRAGKAPAFCAGGDIRFQHSAALAQNPNLDRFFDEEYALNHLIHRYPKPYIALMDGIVMGGGMGLSQRASLRIVTEHSTLAMPETKIGLFPDVGGGWFLSRCPGRIGEYLAITGQSINSADAIMSGLADSLVPSSALEALTSAMLRAQSADEIDALVDASTIAGGPSHLGTMQPEIDEHFGRATMQDIVDSLSTDAGPFARQALDSIRQNSPLMMSIALQQVRRARGMTFAEELRSERALVHNCFHLRPGASSEAVEGIRALVVDKDRHPRWNPPRLEEVTDEAVQRYFSSPWSDANHPLADLQG